ncbi:MAG: rane protein [Proteobacteria bacterium]|nr:rane protein [Pseudomonadota bacterium]
MKNEIRLALLCMAAASVPAFAQSGSPMCGTTNFDQTQSAFTIVNPAAGAVNQQCFIVVHPGGAVPAEARQYPGSYLAEGKYMIELVGGGGGGGGGGSHMQGGGGGGAGAAPSRTTQYLAPGVYKLTIGTGGEGGSTYGGSTGAGNPSSLTNVYTGQHIAGFAGADVWIPKTQAAGSGTGGVAATGGSSGGSGGDSGPRSEEAAQRGGALQTPGYAGIPGQAGSESARSAQADKDAGRVVQSGAGGGGGASIGSGGTGGSERIGSGAQPGGRGGPGLIKLTMLEAAPQALAPAPVVAQMPMTQKHSLSADMLFGFGKSTLKPSGEAKLDELVDKLSKFNIDSITDTGHADRIGSSETNQRISLSRAEAVKAYLVMKGVRSDRIAVVGKGETQPVTGADDCKGAATPKVIACLAPDRRVDVEVVGTHKMVGMN